ncbi:MAG: tetratricopeptide repeat protein [Marinoscillum sp.]
MKNWIQIIFIFLTSVSLGQSRDSFNKAVENYYNFQYVSAIESFKHFVNANDEMAIKARYYLTMSYFEHGYVDEALEHLFAGSDLAVAKYGEESAQAALSYIGYGKFYHERASYDTAKMFYQTALLLLDKNDQLAIGEAFSNLAYAMDFNGEYDSALYFYNKAANIMEHELGLIHPYTDWIYASMPFVAGNAKAYDEQIRVALRSLEIKSKLWGKDSEDYLLALRAVGVAYEHAEDYPRMKDYHEQTLILGEKIYGQSSQEYASYLQSLGNAYQGLKKYDEAISYYTSAFEISKKNVGGKDPTTIKYYKDRAIAYFNKGDYAKALTHYQEHFSMISKNADDVEIIEALEDIASCFENLGNYEQSGDYLLKARKYKTGSLKALLPKTYIALARIADSRQDTKKAESLLKEAETANENFNNSDPSTSATILNNLAIVYQKMNKYEESISALNKALDIRIDIFGKSSPEAGQVYNGLGNVYHTLGQDEKALGYYQKNLEIERNAYGDSHPTYGNTLVNMANVYSSLDNYSKSVECLKTAEKIQLKANGPETVDLVSIYNNLAITFSELLQFEEAKGALEKHKEIVIKIYGEQSSKMASNHNLRALIQHQMGYTNDAVENYEKALRLYENLGQVDQLDQSGVLNNLGTAYMEYGEYAKAEDYLLESLRILRLYFDESHREVLDTKMNLGLIEYGRSNYPKAIDVYKSILGFGKLDTLTTATVYQNLAIAQNLNENYPDAIESTRTSLQLRRSKLGNENQLIADMEANLGNIYLETGELELAAEHFNKSLNIAKLLNPVSSSLTKLYLSFSELSMKKGDYAKSLNYSDLSINANKNPEGAVENDVLYFIAQVHKIDNYYRLYLAENDVKHLAAASKYVNDANLQVLLAEREITNDKDRIEFGVWKSLLANVGVKTALENYKATSDREYLEEAFYFAERSKANVLINALKASNVKSFAGVDQELVSRQRELETNIQKMKQEAFKLSGQPDQNERYNNLRAQLFSQQRAYDEVTNQLEATPKFKELTGAFEITSVAQVQRDLLSENEVIVEYAASDSSLHIFLITKNDFQVFTKPYAEKFEQLITAYRNAIIFKSDGAFDYVSKQLYNLALMDVENYFEQTGLEVSRLWVVPEGPFNYFPFETLTRNGRYIIEDYEVSYTYSLTLAAMLSEGSNNYKNNLLSFAPVFSEPGISTLTAGAKDLFAASRLVSTQEQRGFTINGEQITALPGTKVEVDAIDQMVKSRGNLSETLIYDEAKEEVIKSGIMKDYQYIHFATHGFVNEANPEFSGVFMSQNQESGEDCILFASEIYNLDLHADLVTLSACETGLGKFAYGEGIVGLSRAFLYAGAKNLVVSQWKVSDESTAKLMVDFYGAMMNGSTKSSALRDAKLALIKSEKFKQPYYWAPFVLIGK